MTGQHLRVERRNVHSPILGKAAEPDPAGANGVARCAINAQANGAPGGPPQAIAAAPVAIPCKASLSRFQFLIFTFVVAGLFLMLSIEAGGFVTIPSGVLMLMGISGGSYVVSKGIAKSK